MFRSLDAGEVRLVCQTAPSSLNISSLQSLHKQLCTSAVTSVLVLVSSSSKSLCFYQPRKAKFPGFPSCKSLRKAFLPFLHLFFSGRIMIVIQQFSFHVFKVTYFNLDDFSPENPCHQHGIAQSSFLKRKTVLLSAK